MKFRPLLLTLSLVLPFASTAAQADSNSSNPPKDFFSLSEIKGAEQKPLQPLEYTQASDGMSLAYRAYLPEQAKAVLVFYHGAGAHSGLTYNHIGIGLRDDFSVAVYMPDIRGHGASGGERGDTPEVEQVWSDINNIIKEARSKYPNLPVFVGGHSGGAGLALNYSSWEDRADTAGYVFLSPYFGFRSETNYDADDKERFEFSTVNTSDFVLNSISGGLLFGHAKAIHFNFPERVLKKNPEIVTFNTVNMSNAVTPHSPDEQIAELAKFGLWIGAQDEAFDPLKVTRFAADNSRTDSKEIRMVENENHFSLIISASNYIGPWITETIK
ncbi:alpha/beta hydrolase [Psychromonas ossibalaenae]|uniref:alpha/beta hydrolase n=1 Tax=Psychromonas ossibalaenae TaxID=444922 RepID=UPI000374E1D6|nr:alpha/beta hydrolase [Psychromonas ossibalaenae]